MPPLNSLRPISKQKLTLAALKVIDVNGRFTDQTFSVDIREFLKPGEILAIPRCQFSSGSPSISGSGSKCDAHNKYDEKINKSLSDFRGPQ